MAEEKPSVDSRPNETQPDQPSGAEQAASTAAVDNDVAAADSAGASQASDNAEDSNHTDAGADVAALQTQLEEANSIADKSRDDVLRIRAEMENLRKRQARELENAHKYALDKIAMELLPVRDTLEMGVAAAETEGDLSKIAEGTGLTLKMLTQALEKFNIVEVDPQGDKFDPDLHQAISVQEGTDKPANTVLTVMQKGYTLNDRLLRPAMVVIAK
jgi:molecular chaperone GrpE